MQDEYDTVSKPVHYVSHPSGIECLQVVRHMNFNIGNAIKYLWRYDLKGGEEDLKKAIFYIADEIVRTSDPFCDDEEQIAVRRELVFRSAVRRDKSTYNPNTDGDG